MHLTYTNHETFGRQSTITTQEKQRKASIRYYNKLRTCRDRMISTQKTVDIHAGLSTVPGLSMDNLVWLIK